MWQIEDGNLISYSGDETDLVIPEGTVQIANRAFFGNKRLRSVRIPDTVMKISSFAFAECEALESVEMGENIKRIGEHAFEKCSNLKEMILPDSVRSVQDAAFQDCSGLSRVRLPGQLMSLSNRVFAGCCRLKEAVIPAGVRTVEKEVFSGCTALRSVIFESADTAVWDNSFEGCTGLEEESMRRIPEHFRRPLELWINSSGSGFALRLHNRQERHFVFDDVVCGSLEGVLQSLKFPDSAVQEEICGLSGREAYEAGMDPGWKETQTLYWRGEAYARESAEYDCLMDRLYQAVYDQDPQFRLDVNLLKGAKLYLKKGSSCRANHVQTRAELFWELLRFANPEMSREDAKRMAEAGRKSRQTEGFGENGGPDSEMALSRVFTRVKTEEDRPRIVVLGGSFNPPTAAHLALLKAAVDAADAQLGLFVPTPFWYVERKLKKTGHQEEALPDELRLKMLQSMCAGDRCLAVDESELRRPKGEKSFTFETLEKIQEHYPESRILFVAGSDKLHIIPRWHRIREFVEKFGILVAKRRGESPETVIMNHPFLAEYRESFAVFKVPDWLDTVSSSGFREKVRRHDTSAREMVTKEVWELLKENGKIPEVIDRFREEYDFLSNFYPAEIEHGGLRYLNSEAAFQAQKCLTEEEKQQFTCLPSNKAKRLGRQVQLRPDWEEVKTALMEEIVRAKFSQNPELKEKLLATGEIPLIEGNTWGDTYWGVDLRTGKGDNHLGRILMQVRRELREQTDRKDEG